MNKKLHSLHHQTRESIRKANEAIRQANEALGAATAALNALEEFSDDDLDQVTGAGEPCATYDIKKEPRLSSKTVAIKKGAAVLTNVIVKEPQ